MSLYGTAVIDLAKVDLNSVFDIHSPIAVRNVLGWDPEKVVSASGPQKDAINLSGEEFLALRDVLRTRELLIKFRVPFQAVNCVEDGDCIIGYGTTTYGDPDKILGLAKRWRWGWNKIIDAEPLNYMGHSGYYWVFFQFANQPDRDLFDRDFNLDSFPAVYDRRLKRYKMPASLPGWK